LFTGQVIVVYRAKDRSLFSPFWDFSKRNIVFGCLKSIFFDHFYLFSDFPEVAPDSVTKGFSKRKGIKKAMNFTVDRFTFNRY
jgi:hypothetical protein